MASWVTHLMIADNVLKEIPELDSHCFCVGNIAPDCNVENEDWTQFTPSRETTHWMSANKKISTDCDRFYNEYIENRKQKIKTSQELAFLLGYYSHLIVDAEFQSFIRDPQRVAATWERIKKNPILSRASENMPENWDSVKKLINKNERMKDIYSIEAEYLEKKPNSGYLTEIIGLNSFPNYIDYLPEGAIVRKVNVMGYLPKKELGIYPFIAITKEEYSKFLCSVTNEVIRKIDEKSIYLNKKSSYAYDF